MTDVRVIPFLVSELRLPPGEQALLGREWWPSYAHAVVHRDGIFLFDNGVGIGNAEIEERFSPRVTPIEDALAEHEIALADVTGFANCHLHFDHSGQNARLPKGIPIFVQRAEWAKVHEPDYTIAEWIDVPGLTYEPLEGETEVGPGLRLDPHPRAQRRAPVVGHRHARGLGRAGGAGGAVACRVGGCDQQRRLWRAERARPRCVRSIGRPAPSVRPDPGALRARPRGLGRRLAEALRDLTRHDPTS